VHYALHGAVVAVADDLALPAGTCCAGRQSR
jgi:hypothetical protein